MKISIITPSYNQGRFIEDAIRSVLEQDYPDFEHIVVDNCSTDNTLDVLRKYPHIRWISEPDRGQSHALNKGFRMATGDVLAWLLDDLSSRVEDFRKGVILSRDGLLIASSGMFGTMCGTSSWTSIRIRTRSRSS